MFLFCYDIEMNKDIGIVYGWAEGSRHAKYLRKQFHQEGFHFVRDVSKADIIIAHSGGVFLLPPKINAELILLVGTPHWLGKHPLQSLREKIKYELSNLDSLGYFFRKSFFNFIYFVFKPVHHYNIYNSWKHEKYPAPQINESYIAVRNRHDTFSNQNDMTELAANNKWTVISLEGHHDDLWSKPERYIELIKSMLVS